MTYLNCLYSVIVTWASFLEEMQNSHISKYREINLRSMNAIFSDFSTQHLSSRETSSPRENGVRNINLRLSRANFAHIKLPCHDFEKNFARCFMGVKSYEV